MTQENKNNHIFVGILINKKINVMAELKIGFVTFNPGSGGYRIR